MKTFLLKAKPVLFCDQKIWEQYICLNANAQ